MLNSRHLTTIDVENEHQRIAFHGDFALWHARLKGLESAAIVREQVAAGRADADKVGCPHCGVELLLLSAEALARIGERQEARGLLQEWDRRSAHEGSRQCHRRSLVMSPSDPTSRPLGSI